MNMVGINNITCPICGTELEAGSFKEVYVSPYNKKEYKRYECPNCDVHWWEPLKIIPEFYESEVFEDYVAFHEGVGTRLGENHKAFFEKLKKEKLNINLIIVGSPDEGNPNSISKGELEKWVKEGLIEWHGFQEDVRPFYCMANCVVLPSYREGVPRVLLEAMAMEKPIITTDAPGCRNVCVDGVNGFLVKPRDVESLYLAMKNVVEMGQEELRKMGKKGREIVEQKYEISKIVSEYVKIIE